MTISVDLCPICNRPLGETLIEEHHLIPKTFKGKDTIKLHSICHRKLHSVFSERELLNYYNTIERILSKDEMVSFAKWVAKKPPEYYDGSKDSNARKAKRRK